MGSYSELSERDPKSMHPMAKRVLGSDNEPVSNLQEVFSIKGHLWGQSSQRIDPSHLNVLLVNILSDDLIQLLSGR